MKPQPWNEEIERKKRQTVRLPLRSNPPTRIVWVCTWCGYAAPLAALWGHLSAVHGYTPPYSHHFRLTPTRLERARSQQEVDTCAR